MNEETNQEKCPICGVESEGNNLCESCLNDGYAYCSHCGSIENDGYYIESSGYVCQSCLDRNSRYFYCERCNNYFDSHHDEHYTVEEDSYCAYCIDRVDYYYCNDCGETYYYGYYNEQDDCYYCESCESNHRSNGIVKSYHSTKSQTKRKGKNNLLNPLLGFELEIESTKYGRDDLAERHEEALSKFRVEEDGSLDDGFEIISHAYTYKEHRKRYQAYDKLFCALSKDGAKSHDVDTCGLHIHLSRKHLSGEQIDFLCQFVYANKRKFEKFARRNQNSYCVYRNEQNDDKHCAVNCLPRHTIEFRFFRGTLQTSTIFAGLQMVLCLYFWARSNDRIDHKKDYVLSWDAFRAFIDKKCPKYQEIHDYLAAKGL